MMRTAVGAFDPAVARSPSGMARPAIPRMLSLFKKDDQIGAYDFTVSSETWKKLQQS